MYVTESITIKHSGCYR